MISMISMVSMILSVFSWFPFVGAYLRSFSGHFLSHLSDASMATFGKLSMAVEWKSNAAFDTIWAVIAEGKLSKFLTQLLRHSGWFHKTGVCGRRSSAGPKNWATRAVCFLSTTQIHYVALFHDMPSCDNPFIVTSMPECHKTVMKQNTIFFSICNSK